MTALRASVTALSLFAFAFALSEAREGESPTAKLVSAKAGGPPAVEITGIDKTTLTAITDAKLSADEWASVVRLVVDSGTPEEVAKKPAVAGVWSVSGAALRFEPQFSLVAGGKYRIFCDLRTLPRTNVKGGEFALSLVVPKPPPGPRVRVLGVYPSANRLPENTLRLYVYFSGQVKHGDAYSRFKLVRDDGKEITHPFVELAEELWTADGLRLTLLFDPGRVKRGLVPREELGPILEENRRYTLTIDSNWPDSEDRPLLATFKKSFSVTAPDEEPVWPDQWKLVSPRSGSDAPLLVRLPKPLDRALLGRMLWVVDANGEPVEGTLTVGGGERVVSFAPKKPWAKGEYKLMIDEALEDVCGNRVGEPFEVDMNKPIESKPKETLTERPFVVK